MKYTITILFAASVFAACNSEDKQKPIVDEVAKADERSCYLGSVGKDTVDANLLIHENDVSGTLNYHFSEKDSNEGQLKGTLKGDTLLADYTFNSEGKQSVRQVAFLRKDNQLIEGYGEMEEKDGKSQFKSTGSISFGNGFTLKQAACVR